jgi:hypothetical protein
MTLDASGNLGVGTTSPTSRLHVVGSKAIFQAAGPSQGLIQFGTTDTTHYIGAGNDYLGMEINSTGTGNDGIKFLTGTSGAGAESARITSSGNLLVGTTTANARIEAQNGASGAAIRASNSGGGFAQISIESNATSEARLTYTNAIKFIDSSTERARIDPSGAFLVGRTAQVSGERFVVEGDVQGWLTRFRNTQASSGSAVQGLEINYTALAPNDTTNPFLFCVDTTALRMSIRSNGGIANYQANDVNLSDRREKINFAPAKSYLETICAIPVQTFNYIDQNLEEDAGLTLGVVAQDVQAVAPELVTESNWGTEEEPKMRLSIYQTDLQYALMKAIQELKAEFDAYKASHP